MGKGCVAWLSSTVEELALGEESIEFIKLRRDGNRVVAHKCANSHGWYLAVAEYGVVYKGFIVIP